MQKYFTRIMLFYLNPYSFREFPRFWACSYLPMAISSTSRETLLLERLSFSSASHSHNLSIIRNGVGVIIKRHDINSLIICYICNYDFFLDKIKKSSTMQMHNGWLIELFDINLFDTTAVPAFNFNQTETILQVFYASDSIMYFIIRTIAGGNMHSV